MKLDQEPVIPGHYLLQALDSGFLTQESAHQLQKLVRDAGFESDELAGSGVQIPIRWFSHFVPKDKGIDQVLLAFMFGDRVRLTSQGDLSLVLMTSPSVRESLQVAHYLPLLTNAAQIDFNETDNAGYLFIETHTGHEFLDRLLLYYAVAAIHRLMTIIGGESPITRVQITGGKPTGFDGVNGFTQSTWQFDAAINCIVVEKGFLDRPGVFADPVANAAAKRACETALSELQQSKKLSAVVRNMIRTEAVWEQDKVAEKLHMSRSTLKRRLAQQGTSFIELVNAIRKQQAIKLLLTTELSLQGVAERLGYSDQSNFSHAFKKWVGVSPGEFCRAQRLDNTGAASKTD